MWRIVLFAFMLSTTTTFASEGVAGKRPNIIFLFTDDQGYGDVSGNGNPVLKTPNLDRIRSEGVRFTDFHVSPTCSPSRSVLFTGRHEFKNGVTHTILERERLTLSATTLAQVLQSAGYRTGIFGKWHLGDEPEYQPNRRGFDEVYIHGGGGIGQIYPGSCGDAPNNQYFDPTILHNGVFEKTQGYCTDLFYAQAMKWIDGQRSKNQPFFAYVPTNTPHAPLNARPEDKAIYEGKGLAPNVESFFGMIHNIDQNVGRLLTQLDQWGIARNTLVVFMNDNGGTQGTGVYNAGMRGTKGTAWLGGTRASSFWRWPGTLQPNDCEALTAHLDFFPTIAEIAGAKLSDELKKQVDGRSLVPLLSNTKAEWPDRTLFTHMGRWSKGADPNQSKYKVCSVRTKKWHLVSDTKGGAAPNWELFDIDSDFGETRNVADQNPSVVKDLEKAFDRFWDEALPLMVNEKVVGPRINPFQELYYKQFGGSPTPEAMAKMDPNRPFPDPQPRDRKQK